MELAAWRKTPKPAPGASTDRVTVSSARRTFGSAQSDNEAPRMSDIILLATIVAFFLAAALLVRACSRITDSALADGEPEDTSSELDPRERA